MNLTRVDFPVPAYPPITVHFSLFLYLFILSIMNITNNKLFNEKHIHLIKSTKLDRIIKKYIKEIKIK